MELNYRILIRFADNPKCLVSKRSIGCPALIVRDFFMEMHIVGKHHNLFKMATTLSNLGEKLLDQATHDKQHITIKTRNRVIDHHDPISGDTGRRNTPSQQVVEIKERYEGLLALAQCLLGIPPIRSDNSIGVIYTCRIYRKAEKAKILQNFIYSNYCRLYAGELRLNLNNIDVSSINTFRGLISAQCHTRNGLL